LRRARARTDAAWAALEAALRERHGLADRLVAVIAATAPGEEDLRQEVEASCAAARMARPPCARAAAERELSSVLLRTAGLVTRHPRLGCGPVFVELQLRLARLEDELGDAGGRYNAQVRAYATRRARVPAAVLCRVRAFPARVPYERDAPDALAA
jgi:hypothetical protein